jgi:hypothetical protein
MGYGHDLIAFERQYVFSECTFEFLQCRSGMAVS